MKIKEGFVLKQVAGETVVLPSGDNTKLNVMISLNETGAFLWKKLGEDCTVEELVDALLETYDVKKDVARNSVNAFILTLQKNCFLDE